MGVIKLNGAVPGVNDIVHTSFHLQLTLEKQIGWGDPFVGIFTKYLTPEKRKTSEYGSHDPLTFV